MASGGRGPATGRASPGRVEGDRVASGLRQRGDLQDERRVPDQAGRLPRPLVPEQREDALFGADEEVEIAVPVQVRQEGRAAAAHSALMSRQSACSAPTAVATARSPA